MSVLNGEKYIVDSLDSVIKQSHKEFEFIIINNGSIDKTSKILNDFAKKDNRIKIINQIQPYKAINKVIRLSKGDWIARMDPDDIMHPRRIEKQVAFIKKNKGLEVASSFVYLIDPSNRIVGQTKSDLVDESVLRKKVNENKIIGLAHPAVIMKKESYISIGGYRGQFWPCEDVDLWTRIAQNGGKILVQPEYLLSYRQ